MVKNVKFCPENSPVPEGKWTIGQS